MAGPRHPQEGRTHLRLTSSAWRPGRPHLARHRLRGALRRTLTTELLRDRSITLGLQHPTAAPTMVAHSMGPSSLGRQEHTTATSMAGRWRRPLVRLALLQERGTRQVRAMRLLQLQRRHLVQWCC